MRLIMRKSGFLLAFILLWASYAAWGQTALPESRQSSAEVRVYRLTAEDMRGLYETETDNYEQFLRDFVCGYADTAATPELPRGNYLLVRAEGNRLVYTLHTVDDLQYDFINDKRLQLRLTNRAGETVSNARAKVGHRTMRYDPEQEVYTAGRIRRERILEIEHEGVTHLVGVTPGGRFSDPLPLFRRAKYYFRRKWQQTAYFFQKKQYKGKSSGSAFVTDKPKYRPEETVRWKAHAAHPKGRPLKRPLELWLNGFSRKDTLLATVAPTRPGVYHGEFKLDERLRLKLDATYHLALKTVEGRTTWASGLFRYEDYELNGLQFTLASDRQSHRRTDPPTLTLKATDENGMAVMEGRYEVAVVPNTPYEWESDSGYVPDILWQKDIAIQSAQAEKVTLPDSIFPEGVSFNYRVEGWFVSADNAVKKATANLYYDGKRSAICVDETESGIRISQLTGGRVDSATAEITAYTASGEEISREKIELPADYRLTPHASHLTIRSERAERLYSLSEYKREPLTHDFYSRNDSIFAHVHNPGEYPFWYQLRRGKHVVEEGYATTFDYRGKQRGSKGYFLSLQYAFGGEIRNIEDNTFVWEKNITVSVNTPSLVYPGQKARVEVSLTDHKGRPVRNADVTAYAVTSKFESQRPWIPYFGKAKRNKHKPLNPRETTRNMSGQTGTMDWERWRREMGLDSVAYYRFLHPEPVYHYAEDSKNGLTQISPYAVLDGELQPVYVIKINGEPAYYQGTRHLPVYSFPIEDEFVEIEMRLSDRTVRTMHFNLEKGKRHIFSVDAKQSRSQAALTVKSLPQKQQGKLSQDERDFLSKYLIGVENVSRVKKHYGALGWQADAEYIQSGNRLYYLNPPLLDVMHPWHRSHVLRSYVLTGPFPELQPANFYRGDTLIQSFDIEGGYDYMIRKDYLRLKSFPAARIEENLFPYEPKPDFKAEVPQREDILRMRQKDLIDAFKQLPNPKLVEQMISIDKSKTKTPKGTLNIQVESPQDSSALFFIILTDENHSLRQAYSPKSRRFEDLPAGEITLTFVMDDFRFSRQTATIRPNGTSFLRFESLPQERDSAYSRWLCKYLKEDVFWTDEPSPQITIPDSTAGDWVQGRTFSAFDGQPLPGCTILIKGTTYGTATDENGYFSLPIRTEGDTLVFAFVGCERQELPLVRGGNYQIYMEGDRQALEEVVVEGDIYSIKETLTGSFMEESAVLSRGRTGRIPGAAAWDEGSAVTETGSPAPLLIVDGKPFEGTLGDLDEGSIVSVKRIAAEESVELYGNQAAGGALIVTTGKRMDEETPGNSLRQNFSDAAFWQPALLTDKEGKASFEATYPDDVTSWDAYVLAFGPGKRTGAAEVSVKSFKSLMARLSLPRFAIAGDSLNAVGRLNNYLGDTVTVTRSIATEAGARTKEIRLATSQVDTIPLTVPAADTLQATYSLETANGYFDGERRAIPVYRAGCEESEGVFRLLDKDTTLTFRLDTLDGDITVHAEASPMEVFLQEIERVELYPYLCNEQMASKLKTLLLKKRIYQWTNREFRDDKKINTLIKKLTENQNAAGLWGWWNKNGTEHWISRQVVEALCAAREAGYAVRLKEDLIVNLLLSELRSIRDYAPQTMKRQRENWANALEILQELGIRLDYANYIRAIDSLAPPTGLGERLQWLRLKQAAGIAVEPDSVMKCSQRNLLGGLYWSEETKTPRLLPFRNNTQHTLAAYRVLRAMGGHEEELRSIRTYFFEVRGHNSWRNTYESSRILETILPDMMKQDTAGPPTPRLRVNGEEVKAFPFTRAYPSQEAVTVSKEGGAPVFFTAYRTAWNPTPEKREGEFRVRSYFTCGQDTVEVLQAGQEVNLEVEVEVTGEANYAMIEIPIPAGCSYAAKDNYPPSGTHAEYWKEKVVMFHTRLTEGKHTFRIALLPRFTGRYHLNPARAELMYFPTFHGREGMKQVGVAE